jgi:hypothetical protein
MADIKFACPNCQQHLQAEPGYAGLQIVCPSCKNSFAVPRGPAVVVRLSGAPPAYTAAPGPAPAPPAIQAPPEGADAGCPSCGSALPRGVVLCTRCGYNQATGQRTVAGRLARPGEPITSPGESPWYKTAPPYVGALVVVLGVLYYFGRENPTVMLAFLGVAALYSLTAHIMVVIAAFQESVGTGFLTLCIPFYGLYYVFKVSDSNTLKLLYSVAVIINIALRFSSKMHD